MLTADFDYDLPESAIAQLPAEPRDAARLLDLVSGRRSPEAEGTGVDARGAGSGKAMRVEHRTVAELDQLLDLGDVLVVNDSRVRRARLELTKPTGGRAEVLLLDPLGGGSWTALVGASRPVRPNTVLIGPNGMTVEVGERRPDGSRQVSLDAPADLDESALADGDIGAIPLPPYVAADLDEPERYQTVYANRIGSVAAPTAGLHLTHDLLDRIAAKGVGVERVELRVGIGTFQPIRAERLADHQMHAEAYAIEPGAWDRIRGAERVVAIGTTTVRALESAAATGELSGSTDLFISPGFDWKVVDRLMTNFHTPTSSLLVMLEAFMGQRWRQAYEIALAEGYRFLSLGDAMFCERAIS